MQRRLTYYSNQAAAASQAAARTQAYLLRVQQDGGTVQNAARVQAAYQYLDALPPATTGVWISPYFGNRINAQGQVERAYCLFGNDLCQAPAATSQVRILPNGLNGHRCYATNQGALQVEKPGFHLPTTEATVAAVFSTDNTNITVLAEYSVNMNATRGFVVSVEDAGAYTMTLHQDAGYAIAALPGAVANVPATLLGTWNVARSSRESRLLVQGVRADYSRRLHGSDYNADNPELPLPAQPLWIGARQGTDYGANILLGDFCLLTKEVTGTSETALYELLDRAYQPRPDETPVPQRGLQGWWSADSGVSRNDSGQVTAWQDRSANQFVMTAEAGLTLPSVVESWTNGRPAIQFDGTCAFLPLLLPQAAPTAYTVALVLHKQPQTTNGMPCMFGQNKESANDLWVHACFGLNNFNSNVLGITGAEARLTQPVVVLAELHSNQALAFRLWLNGERQAVETLLNPAIDRPLDNLFRLGDATFHDQGIYRWQGCIAEVLVYDRILEPTEQDNLQQYLLSQYRLGSATAFSQSAESAPAPVNRAHYLAANTTVANQYLLVPVPALETVTLSFWLWKDSDFIGSWEYILDWRDTVPDSWFATHHVGNNWDWYVNGVRRTGHNLSDTLVFGAWHHCILQLQVPAPAGTLTVCSRYSLNEQMRNIRLADLRVYGRHFTPVEVLNYDQSPTDSLVSHYEFRHDTATTAYDSAGSHHASLHNF